MRRFLLLSLLVFMPHAAQAALTIAAAADLKFALEEIVARFRQAQAAAQIETIYGSSGKFHTQIRQGAPFDLFFSADIQYPRLLAQEGLTASDVRPYARGRLVLWSATRDASRLKLGDLADPVWRRIAIAQPKHAPYGKRAEEAMRAAGVWERVESRLVMGENIAQAAQYVQTGNADVGLIALSLAISGELAAQGAYALVPEALHSPLEQGFVITRRAAGNPLAQAFADYMSSAEARRIMVKYGFLLPGEPPVR